MNTPTRNKAKYRGGPKRAARLSLSATYSITRPPRRALRRGCHLRFTAPSSPLFPLALPARLILPARLSSPHRFLLSAGRQPCCCLLRGESESTQPMASTRRGALAPGGKSAPTALRRTLLVYRAVAAHSAVITSQSSAHSHLRQRTLIFGRCGASGALPSPGAPHSPTTHPLSPQPPPAARPLQALGRS